MIRRLARIARRIAEAVELPDDVQGYRLTWRRLANLYLNRYEAFAVRPVLRSRPSRLVIEPTNICNLRCPYCHTGAGRLARRPGMMHLEPYLHLLDEIGAYLLLVEVFNWGEPLLHPDLPAIIAAASRRGIATRVNTNLSVPFTERHAERLIESGLSDLFISIDGASQEVYERYRVRGNLELVLRNCRLVADAKRRLHSELPRLTLQFLQFPCNAGEADRVAALAASLGMRLLAFRGATPDRTWDQRTDGPPWFLMHRPRACPFLWGQPVLTVDGNLAPCRGVFQASDDFTRLAAGNGDGPRPFRAAWNADRYRLARGLFRARTGSTAERALPCYECPTTIFHERWRMHRQAGGRLKTFDPGMPLHVNGAWNYFWARGQGADLDDPLPIRGAVFDAVSSSSVSEHLTKP
jgi:pyruvate-formate lyase-activating enzyme